MLNPYENIDWANVLKIPACSHQHCETQAQFNNIVGSGMYRLYAFSNYYPSAPVYPLSSKFTDIPEDAISCPNAEHHGTNITALHFNGIGCTKVSGSPRYWEDGQWVYEEPVGFGGLDWRSAFGQVLATLQFSDGGGITINHPAWSNRHGGLSQQTIEEMLNYDTRVLGIEVWNANYEDGEASNWDWTLWDAILKKGKRCWGFAASDHTGQNSGTPEGRNILLCSDTSERECLRAYRDGRFYCQRHKTDLAFTGIVLEGNTLSVSASGATKISIVINGNKTEHNGNSVSINLPNNCIYVRAEAESADDIIWCNPIMIGRGGSFNDKIPTLFSL